MSTQDNIGLQRFTDFESLKTKEDFFLLQKEDPKALEEINSWINFRLNEELNREDIKNGEIDKYFQLLEDITEITRPERLSYIKNNRYQYNRHKIEAYINRSILNNNRLPTQNEIVNNTGLSRVTIGKHLKEGAGSIHFKEEMETYRLMTGRVLNALYKIGMENNNVKALKVFLDYHKDNSSTTPIKTQNNYLQINNTRIDEFTVNLLPDEARLQIETILKQYQTV